jgi:hypothetical protein
MTERKHLGEKTIMLNGVRFWKGTGSTIYMRINKTPHAISKYRNPKLHKELLELFER